MVPVSVTILSDGDLQWVGQSTGGTGSPTLTWQSPTSVYGALMTVGGPDENYATGRSAVSGQQGGLAGDWVPVIVPEPSTIALVGFGVLGALAIRRRKA